MQRPARNQPLAAATTTTTTAAALSSQTQEEINKIETKLEDFADKVADLSKIHHSFLQRVENCVKVTRSFENETRANEAEERGLEGQSRTF